MELEFHQLDLACEHLRVRRPDKERKLMASLATSDQRVPIVVVATDGTQSAGYRVIDGPRRTAVLRGHRHLQVTTSRKLHNYLTTHEL